MLTFPPDISFIIQLASFFVLWLGLKRLLFDPVMRVLEEREARTAGAVKEAAAMRATADTAAAEYDRRMQELRHALAADRETTRQATQSAERQVLSDAREQASAQLAQLRESLGRQAAAARPALASDARGLAAQMVERVIGRPLA